MSILVANGIFWPYAVIWASSQARTESLSFLCNVWKSISTGTCVSFNQRASSQNILAINEWNKSQRKHPEVNVTNDEIDRVKMVPIPKSDDPNTSTAYVANLTAKDTKKNLRNQSYEVNDTNVPLGNRVSYKENAIKTFRRKTTPLLNISNELNNVSGVCSIKRSSDVINIGSPDRRQSLPSSILLCNTGGTNIHISSLHLNSNTGPNVDSVNEQLKHIRNGTTPKTFRLKENPSLVQRGIETNANSPNPSTSNSKDVMLDLGLLMESYSSSLMKSGGSHLRGTYLRNDGTKDDQKRRVNTQTLSSESMTNEGRIGNSNQKTSHNFVNNKPNDSNILNQLEMSPNTLNRGVTKGKNKNSSLLNIATISSDNMINDDKIVNINRKKTNKLVYHQQKDSNILVQPEGPSDVWTPGASKIKRENVRPLSAILAVSKKSNPIKDIHTGIYLGTTKKITRNGVLRPGSATFNLPGMIEDEFLSDDHSSFIPRSRESIKRTKGKTLKSMVYEHPHDSGVQTVSELTLILGQVDSHDRYSVNSIRDPIRRCNNISSIHMGNFLRNY